MGPAPAFHFMAKILLIEDDDDARTLMANVLQQSGHTVIQAGNGTRGMYEFHRMSPDLVVTDVIMPGQEGIETVRRIRQHNPQTQLLVISGGGRWNSAEYCLSTAKKLGANRVLEKPFTREDFIEEVQALVGTTS